MTDYKYHYNSNGKVRPFFQKHEDAILPSKQSDETEMSLDSPGDAELFFQSEKSPVTSFVSAEDPEKLEDQLSEQVEAAEYMEERQKKIEKQAARAEKVAIKQKHPALENTLTKHVLNSKSDQAKKRSRTEDVLSDNHLRTASEPDDDQIEIISDNLGNSDKEWESRVIGTLQAEVWCTRPGTDMVKFGDKLRFERDAVNAYRDRIVRVVNERNQMEFARLSERDARFAAVLMETKLCSFTGSCVYAKKTLLPGDNVVVEMRCHLLRTAFGQNWTQDDETSVFDNSKETLNEALLRCRQEGLNTLFTRLGLSEAVVVDSNVGDTSNNDDNDTVTQEEVNRLYQTSAPPDAALTGVDPPKTFKCELRPYQRKGLEWMLYRETPDSDDPRYNDPSYKQPLNPLWQEISWPFDEGSFYVNFHNGELSASFPNDNSGGVLGGILADEMGLGKTISTLALIDSSKTSTLAIDDDNFARGTTLVVCPMSLLTQWEAEAHRVGISNVYVCYGASQANIRDVLLNTESPRPDIVLTSYGTLHADHRRLKEFRTKNAIDCQWFDHPRAKEFGLFGIKFHRVVLDEGHNIRNRTTIAARACNDLRAEKKWVLTGTPVVNKLEDLYSLIKFLGVEPWTNFSLWRSCVTRPFQNKGKAGKGYVNALKVVQSIMEPILLRRTKDMESEDGKPLIMLPSKSVMIDKIEFSDNERALYDWVYARVRDSFKKSMDQGEAFKNYTTILTQILRLRQACCHPSLILNIAKYQYQLEDETIEGDRSDNDGQIINMNNVDLKAIMSNFTSSQITGESIDEEKQLTSYSKTTVKQIMSGLDSECPICTEEIAEHQAAVTSCFHVGCLDCLLEHTAYQKSKGNTPQCPICRRTIECIYLIQRHGDDMKQVYLKKYRSTGQSAKIRALLNELRQQKVREKIVVFSQFTGFLDLIENELNYSGFPTLRFDGSLSQSKRAKILDTFSNDATPYVLLMSLKAGGVGLNLVSSHRLYLMDPWWSFAIESQAIDRVHRMGQTHDVSVTRFIVRGTVEERMLKIQERKAHLAVTLGMTKEEQKERRLEDIMLLFAD